MIQSNSIFLKQQSRSIADVIATAVNVKNYNVLIVDLDLSSPAPDGSYLYAQKDGISSRADFSSLEELHSYQLLKKSKLIYDLSTTDTFKLALSGADVSIITGSVYFLQEAISSILPENSFARVLNSSGTHTIPDYSGLYNTLIISVDKEYSDFDESPIIVYKNSAQTPNIISPKTIKYSGGFDLVYDIPAYSSLIYAIDVAMPVNIVRNLRIGHSVDYSDILAKIEEKLPVASTQLQFKNEGSAWISTLNSIHEYAVIRINTRNAGTQIRFRKSNEDLPFYNASSKTVKPLDSTGYTNTFIVKCGVGDFDCIINTNPRLSVLEYGFTNVFPDNLEIKMSSSTFLLYDLMSFLNGKKWSVNVEAKYNGAIGMSSITFENSGGDPIALKGISGTDIRYLWFETDFTGYLDLTDFSDAIKCRIVKNANCEEVKYSIRQIAEIPSEKKKVTADLSGVTIYENKLTNTYRYGDVLARLSVESEGAYLWISYTRGDNWFKIPFTSDFFQGLKNGSVIEYIYILPVKTYRTIKNSCRIVVITDRRQIYHNCPESANNIREWSGICTFRESALWDLPFFEGSNSSYSHNLPNSRFIPSLDPTAVFPYRYFPSLPRGNGYRGDNWYDNVDTSVFPAKREYQVNDNFKVVYNRYIGGTEGSSPLMVLRGNMAIKPGLTVLGTYAGTNRSIVWATFDGGIEWYASYEFGGANYPVSGFGYEGIDAQPNTITGPAIDTNIAEISSALGSGLFSAYLRKENLPDGENKEPVTGWTIGDAIAVTSISKARPALVTTSVAHGLQDRDIIFFKKNNETVTDFDFLSNPTASENSAGNGTFFYVKVVNATSFKLFWMMSNPDNPLPARHIHSVNNTADGFIVSTGEEYTNKEGWIMKANIGVDPTDPSLLPRYRYDRLNSTDKSISRSCGFLIDGSDNSNPDCYFASDSRRIEIPLAIEGRTNLMHIPSGIFKGKFSDIDDFSMWECVCPNPHGVIEYMQQWGRNVIAVGLESIFIFDGERWHEYPIYSGYYRGAHDKGVIINNFEIEF